MAGSPPLPAPIVCYKAFKGFKKKDSPKDNNSHPDVFCKKGVMKNLSICTLNTVAGLHKIFAKSLRHSFLSTSPDNYFWKSTGFQ